MKKRPPALLVLCGRRRRRAVGPLGINAKSVTPTREVRLILQGSRAKRFALLATARKVMISGHEAQKLQFPAEIHRVCKCKWVPRHDLIGVHQDLAHQHAFFSQLVTCGSVWACPVCSAKVQERRREEIQKGMQWAYAQGLQCAMVTFTAPHQKSQHLADLLAMFGQALQKTRAGNPWKKVKEKINFQGLIRSLELTYGSNGWHVHTHEIWMISQHANMAELKEKVIERWLSACIKTGLVDPLKKRQIQDFLAHSVDIKPFVSSGEYLAKMDDSRHWGADRELAKSSTKQGKKSGIHPFGLLEIAAQFREGDGGIAAKLFREYVTEMTGKRQIFWTHGLKKRAGIDEKTDEELSEEQREKAVLLGDIPRDDWQLVREAGLQAHILELAEDKGWELFRSY